MLAHIIEKLKQEKVKQNLTTQQIADRCDIPASTISRLLSGQTDNPSIYTLSEVCRALSVSLDELFGIARPEPPKVEQEPPQSVVDHGAELAAMYKDQLAAKDSWIKRLFFVCIGLTCALTALALVAALN